MGIFEKFKIGFKKSASTFTSGLRDIIIKKEIDDKTLNQIEDYLIQSDVGVDAAYEIKEIISTEKIDPKKEILNEVNLILKNYIIKLMTPLEKNNFFGAKALQNKVQSGVDIKIVYLEVDVDNADARGNEPVYHNNKIVGVVTSGGYGFRTKKSLAFAYVKSDLANGENLEIEIQGQKRKAKILDKVVYDPDNQKLRA